jgi:phosphatidylglycerophosphatase B
MRLLRPILPAVLSFYGLLVFTVFVLPVAFSACSRDSAWCAFMYGMTESGGQRGTTVIVLLAAILYAGSFNSLTQKARVFFLTVLTLGAILASFAYLNENVIKTLIRVHRPSHTYILHESKSTADLDSLYSLAEPERRKFYENLILPDTVTFRNMDPRVVAHWIDEVGYSFPSGHSFNTFLLGTILAFFIYHLAGKRFRWLHLLPLVWAMLVAISRVAMGVHTARDVSAGAALGIVLASLVLSIPVVRGAVLKKESDTKKL